MFGAQNGAHTTSTLSELQACGGSGCVSTTLYSQWAKVCFFLQPLLGVNVAFFLTTSQQVAPPHEGITVIWIGLGLPPCSEAKGPFWDSYPCLR